MQCQQKKLTAVLLFCRHTRLHRRFTKSTKTSSQHAFLPFESLRPLTFPCATAQFCHILVEPVQCVLSWCDNVCLFCYKLTMSWPQNSNTVVNFLRWKHDGSQATALLAIRTSGVGGYDIHRITIVTLRPDVLYISRFYRLQHTTVSGACYTSSHPRSIDSLIAGTYIQRQFASST